MMNTMELMNKYDTCTDSKFRFSCLLETTETFGSNGGAVNFM